MRTSMAVTLALMLCLGVVAFMFMGVEKTAEQPLPSATPTPPVEDSLPETSPKSTENQEVNAEKPYNILVAVTDSEKKANLAFVLGYREDAVTLDIKKLQCDCIENTEIDVALDVPVADINKKLVEQHDISTEGYAVVTEDALKSLVKAVGDVTVGDKTLTHEELLKLLYDDDFQGEQLELKFNVGLEIAEKAMSFGTMEQIALAPKIMGKVKAYSSGDFSKMNELKPENITFERIK